MKKLLSMAGVAAAVAFWAPGAKAGIGITTNSTPLNVSFIITTSDPLIINNGSASKPASAVKWDNATLLTIFGHWAGSNWPAGTKLVVGWDRPWNGQPLLVDKSGTNVLFNAAQTGKPADFSIEFSGGPYGPYTKKLLSKNPGSETETYKTIANFNFSDDEAYLPYTSFSGEGNETISYTQNWDQNGNLTTWSQEVDIEPIASASGEYQETGPTVLTGSINSSGSGKGTNFWYLNQSEYIH